MGSAALPHADGPGGRQGTAMDFLRLPQPRLRPPARNAPQAVGECGHTRPALPANPRLPRASRQPGGSRSLKQARPDLLPGDDRGRILLMPSNAVIKFGPLGTRQRYCVRFQAFPNRIQQLCLLRSGEAIDLASQIAHMPITLARFVRTGKHIASDSMRPHWYPPDLSQASTQRMGANPSTSSGQALGHREIGKSVRTFGQRSRRRTD